MNNRLPTESEIIALHEKYAPSEAIFDAVYSNCQAVWRIAELVLALKERKINEELVKAGCLLHDIGTYKLIQPTDTISVGYVNRGVAGEQIIEEEGLPKALGEILAHHVGLGFTKEHIEATLPLPHRDLTPQTIEERIVTYASKLHSRSEPPQFNSVSAYRKHLKNLDAQYYSDLFEALVDEFGEPDLEPLAKEFSQKLA
ncbi:MAG: HD domain-containing protein [Patescibacteria group bacterium]